MNQKNENTPKISIGLPVYNGVRFIHKRLESLLSQTFTDFELIISDNASTDSTSDICKEFASKDTRIHYFRQEYNIGIVRNLKYVLDKARCDYFVWASVDDIWLPEFLEENINSLENNKNFVGSVSKIEPYGKMRTYKRDKFSKKVHIFSYDNYPDSASYEVRTKFYLRFWSNENLYGVFRTKEFKKSFIRRPMGGMDKAILLNSLKYGEIHIINKILMHRFTEGFSRTASVMDKLKHVNGYGFVGIIFPFLPFTFWCARNLGIKIFLKNLDYFIYINYARERLVLKTFCHILKNKISI